jgi:hypothetical protein
MEDRMDEDALIQKLDDATAPGVGRLIAAMLREYGASTRADERAACIALVYGHAGSDNDAQRIVDAIKQRGEGNGS